MFLPLRTSYCYEYLHTKEVVLHSNKRVHSEIYLCATAKLASGGGGGGGGEGGGTKF